MGQKQWLEEVQRAGEAGTPGEQSLRKMGGMDSPCSLSRRERAGSLVLARAVSAESHTAVN